MASSLIKINGTPLWDNDVPQIGALGYAERYMPTNDAINMIFTASNGTDYFLPFCKKGITVGGWAELSDQLRITKNNNIYVPYRKLQKITLSITLATEEERGNYNIYNCYVPGSTKTTSIVHISKEFPDDFTYWAIAWQERIDGWGINVSIGGWRGVSTVMADRVFDFLFINKLCVARNKSGNIGVKDWYYRGVKWTIPIAGDYYAASCLDTDGNAKCDIWNGRYWTISNALKTSYARTFICDTQPIIYEKKYVSREKTTTSFDSSGVPSTSTEIVWELQQTTGRTGYWHCYF